MKAILVIDIPEEYMGSDIDVRLYGKNQTIHERYVNKLRPMPNKLPLESGSIMNTFKESTKYKHIGWNDCLDEILGDELKDEDLPLESIRVEKKNDK